MLESFFLVENRTSGPERQSFFLGTRSQQKGTQNNMDRKPDRSNIINIKIVEIRKNCGVLGILTSIGVNTPFVIQSYGTRSQQKSIPNNMGRKRDRSNINKLFKFGKIPDILKIRTEVS